MAGKTHTLTITGSFTTFPTFLLVRHGGGDERIRLSGPIGYLLAKLGSNERYWLLNAIYHAHYNGARDGRFREQERWKRAAIDKRIKIRKAGGTAYVRIDPEKQKEVVPIN